MTYGRGQFKKRNYQYNNRIFQIVLSTFFFLTLSLTISYKQLTYYIFKLYYYLLIILIILCLLKSDLLFISILKKLTYT